ncbi:unnamed protein product [Allacma fusca]|uniref:Uncharacterized protein n=1 Tax=Allacma fusca TaxID=39272 RepID=A0A8J2K3P2_9HEXA|nr:unnamed protein product [Allacma fusca]
MCKLVNVFPDRLKVAAWMLSFIINALQLTAAFSLLRGSLKGESFASIQYCCYWFSMSMFIIIMLSIQFFFSFRSSFPVLLYYLAHIIFRAVGMLHVHEYIQELENFTGSRYTTAVALQVPSSSNPSHIDKMLDRSPETSTQFA